MRALAIPIILCSFACAGALHEHQPRASVSTSDNIEHGEGVFDGDGLVRLFEEWWRPAGKPPRAVLVLLHGYKDHSSRYAELADRLAQRGLAVHAYDLRGQGSSGGRRDYVEGFDEFLEDLDLFLPTVRQREPGKQIFVLGVGLGGLIAVDYVLKKKPQLAGLILSAPDLESKAPATLVKICGAISPLLAIYSCDPAKQSKDPKVIQSLQGDPLIEPGNGTARLESEVIRAMSYVEDHKAELELPLYVLAGSSDQVSSAQVAKHFVDDVSSADKDYQAYVGLFHDLLHEPERELVMQDISDWLDKRIGTGDAPPPPVKPRETIIYDPNAPPPK